MEAGIAMKNTQFRNAESGGQAQASSGANLPAIVPSEFQGFFNLHPTQNRSDK